LRAHPSFYGHAARNVSAERSLLRRGSVRRLLLSLGIAAACSVARPLPDSGGVHPAGWDDRQSDAFHARWLRANTEPLGQCQGCHGDDFGGGAVGVSCASSQCHTKPVTSCATCHGTGDDPHPQTGAHGAHRAYCDACHRVPARWDAPGHLDVDRSNLVSLAGIAAFGGHAPSWDPAAGRCADTYCHGGRPTPSWNAPTPLDCNGCHDAPPASHARFGRTDQRACASCHPMPPDSRHVDGKVDVLASVLCSTCHGSGPLGAPPPALDGSSDPTTRGAGAHRRHLDPTLADRIGRVAPCESCHVVPKTPADPGHVGPPPAKVLLAGGGSYDPASATCVSGCHFDRAPGPRWTDASGAARACDACHGFPPDRTREGTPHPIVAADIDVCRTCHVFDPLTHVDGIVDFVR
jgi:predicted CxxxxCH...CXXCH cytochrome family protein